MYIQKKEILSFFDIERDRMLEFWKEIVSIESGSLCKSDLDNMRDFLVESFESIGGVVSLFPYKQAGDLIVVDFNKEINEQPIIFSGHYDTVFDHGTINERPFKLFEGRAYGPGVLDMKAGITMLFFITKALLKFSYKTHPIRIVLAGDEEVGHNCSTAAIDFSNSVKGACAAFNFETGYIDNGFVVGRKGTSRAYFTIKGVGAHAGNEPENGRSAILEMAHKIIAIQKLNNFKEGLSFNCGVVKGGTVANAVPELCKMTVDIRFCKYEQIDFIKKSLIDLAKISYIDGTHTEIEFELQMAPMETTEGVQSLFKKLKKSAEELEFGEIYPKFVGGGADSAYEVKMGIPTICAVGVAGGKNHTIEEYAIVDSMFERCKLITQTVLSI